MKRLTQVTVIFSVLMVSAVALTQPVPKPMAKPAPMEAAMAAPAPTMAAPMKPAAKPEAMKPAAKPAAMKPAAMVPAMSAAKPAMKAAPKKESKDSKAAFWLTILTPILVGLLSLLGGLGLFKGLQHARAQTILKTVKSGVESFLKYSEGTKAEWDDAVAKLLKDVNEVLIAAGQKPMSEDEEKKAEKAAKALKEVVGPDKKPEDDK